MILNKYELFLKKIKNKNLQFHHFIQTLKFVITILIFLLILLCLSFTHHYFIIYF